MKSREVVEQLFGKPKSKEQKSLEDFKKKQIPKPDKPKSMEIPDNAIGIDEFKDWLIENNLEQYLNIDEQITTQEARYQQFYGEEYQINRNRLFIEKERLPLIKHGLEKQSVNYALITATPEELTEEEQQQTEAEYVYHKLIEPLEKQGMKIWDKDGAARWTKLTVSEWLKRVMPVKLSDFKVTNLTNDKWQQELIRVIDKKKQPEKQQPNKLQITFTNSMKDMPNDQILINQDNQETTVEGKYSFNEMIKNKIKVLTPEQWMILASQLYAKDKTEISKNTWDWLMAIVDHRDKEATPKVSAVGADSYSGGLNLFSVSANYDYGNGRWRVAL
jgi:Fe-S cluster assembly scaffold protein SufB